MSLDDREQADWCDYIADKEYDRGYEEGKKMNVLFFSTGLIAGLLNYLILDYFGSKPISILVMIVLIIVDYLLYLTLERLEK